MKRLTWTLLALSLPAWAQSHELAFSLGSTTNDLGTSLALNTTSGRALQVNYGYRFAGTDAVSIAGEIHFLANPLRTISGGPATLTRDFASLYLTPGIRVKLNPNGRIQPFGVIGGGYALYEQSRETTAGTPNPAPRHVQRGALTFGGGVDLKIVRWLGVRADVRDFYTGRPALNSTAVTGRQHNVVASGGVVFHWGK
jgi:opacity protein-like surface antigen